MTIGRSIAGALALIGLSVAAQAQETVEFRLTPASANLAACRNLDASLSRVHTVTLDGDKSSIKSSGGINDRLKQPSPGNYVTDFALGGVKLHVIADANAKPRTLKVVEANWGCRWDAIAK